MRTCKFLEEKDGCAIVAIVDKRGRSTHANITGTIDALQKMGHRSGDIHGEGDGCGIICDIPRTIWAGRLANRGLSPHLAESGNFFNGHFLLPSSVRPQAEAIILQIRSIFAEHGIELLCDKQDGMRESELGPRARADAPLFWQVAGMAAAKSRKASARKLFSLQLAIELKLPEVHIASLDIDSAVYKLQGTPDMLPRVYPELLEENMRSVMCLGHSRYSTNTLPSVTLSQPFSIVCHNGEINTHDRLRDCGRAIGIDPMPGSSDSQSLNRVIEGLVYQNRLDIMEAMEMVFPAIQSEVENYPPELRQLYTFYRWFFPCSAQGPAAVLARFGDKCIGSVDALGLRPLWFVESDYDYVLSSEKGVVDLKRTVSDPKPLAPGEKISLFSGRGRPAEMLDYSGYQKRLLELLETRLGSSSTLFSFYSTAHTPSAKKDKIVHSLPWQGQFADRKKIDAGRSLSKDTALLSAFGWQHYDLMIREKVSRHGREVIGSLGHTGPLAVFVPESLPNITDYFKENVAVVTNPAIDREREREHFSTRVILGSRPDLRRSHRETPVGLEITTPLLLGGDGGISSSGFEEWRCLGREFNTMVLEDVLDYFSGRGSDPARVCILDATFSEDEKPAQALERLNLEAAKAIDRDALLLILDDSLSFTGNRVYIDPALAVASLNRYLLAAGLRSRTSIIVRSAAIRNLHDIMMMLGLGADALNPYLLWQVSADFISEDQSWHSVMSNTIQVLQKGMEKVMSTMGIHELGGYGRVFSPIGLSGELLDIFRTPGLCASERTGLTLDELEEMGRKRSERACSHEQIKIYREPAKNPKVGRILRQMAVGKSDYRTMSRELEKTAVEMPTGIRHLLDFKKKKSKRTPPVHQVDLSVGEHSMPLLIAAMSFGSQGENSFRTYAEAAQKVNIICINGEGGEIPDMLGRFRANRGQQIASGRFGVSMEFLNSADFLEIKIGQGAKPGEGGHLPGNKVTGMVAAARHCKKGTTLISPANHHDIYSIEDLAQIITELKTANPSARVSVKIPVTNGVGTIAVGIAKAGADIVNLSGFEGGTGAAREHAKRNVGQPVEIGVSYAHRALLEAGLRSEVEIWADGGVRSGADVLKLILLGANRVGLGTAVLMAIGCISCRRCHLDRCPRGISTQLGTVIEAEDKGVRGFKPREVKVEVENLARLLNGIGDEIRYHMVRMGEKNLHSLVGRTDLLVQTRMKDRLDAAQLLDPVPAPSHPVDTSRPWVIHKPLDHLTKLFSDLTMTRFARKDPIVHFAEDQVRSTDRAVGTYLAGAMTRHLGSGTGHQAFARFGISVPGNGLFAFNISGISGIVEGGSQDGAGKGSSGGSLSVLKGRNLLGRMVDGSTGKSFAYGAIGGLFFIQNMADSRACIRLSGAEVVFGARIRSQLEDQKGNIASRAHLKGFAFEYMTSGTVVVLGDPGPWICAGMTGGVIYQCLYPEFGFDRDALKRRIAESALVRIRKLSKKGLDDIGRLLGQYIAQLENALQNREAEAVNLLLLEAENRFVMIMPAPLRPVSAE